MFHKEENCLLLIEPEVTPAHQESFRKRLTLTRLVALVDEKGNFPTEWFPSPSIQNADIICYINTKQCFNAPKTHFQS